MSLLRIPRFVVLVALVGALFVGVGPIAVGAVGPTLSANPTQVAFSAVPGQAGTTKLTATSNDQGSYALCVSDNTGPAIRIQDIVNTPSIMVDIPFIQAGSYRFFLAAVGSCSGEIVGTSVTVQRAGPTGLVGVDDLQVTPAGDQSISAATQFPQNGQVCFMSGNGAQKSLNLLFGQDPRDPIPFGTTKLATPIDTTVNGAVLGQNGCYAFNAIVNGYYRFSLGTAAPQFIGFCGTAAGPGGANEPNIDVFVNITPFPRRCAQIAFSASAGASPVGRDTVSLANANRSPAATIINGAIVTGIEAQAVQVCVSAFSAKTGGALATDAITQLANTVNAYNQTGAVRLTPLTLTFPTGTVVKISTYVIQNPGQPGGVGGAQFVCPAATALQTTGAGVQTITSISQPAVTNTVLLDSRYFTVT